ncbi:hypothetical protein NDU88_002135 [Pleurodeles waltl]|uniref:Uncharacterized protein n=1 Tax=Pleurodeles waltl TaxID=8319 RepID=A0AAV7UCC0_PLEWA|nr:hypothetical protein NDU88_002135 [Pleurodeles waltl]
MRLTSQRNVTESGSTRDQLEQLRQPGREAVRLRCTGSADLSVQRFPECPELEHSTASALRTTVPRMPRTQTLRLQFKGS